MKKTQREVFELLRKRLRPEFLNRIDELVLFNPIAAEQLEGIIRIQLKNLEKVLLKQEIQITSTDNLMQYLKREGYDLQFGARPLKRLIQKRVIDALSLALLEGSIQPGSKIKMDVVDNKLVFETLYSNVDTQQGAMV